MFIKFSKTPKHLITQNSIWTVPRLSQSGGQSVGQSVSQYLLTLNLQVHSQASPRGICGGWRVTGTCFRQVLRFSSVRFILWLLHNHNVFTYYCRCITLATDSIFKQYSRIHAHMTYPPTHHTHTHITAFNSCHIYRHQTYRHCKATRCISSAFHFQHTAKYYIKFPHVPSSNVICNIQ